MTAGVPVGGGNVKCKKCKADMPDNLHPIFCCYCGEKLQRERKKKDEIKIPTPRKRGQKWYVDLRREGVTVIEETEAEAKAKALAIRAGFVPVKKKPGDMTLSEAITKYIESRTNRLDATSKQQYEYIRDNRFKDLMPLKLSEITDKKIDEAFDAELGKPSRKGGTLSKKTVNDALNLVKAVLRKYCEELEVTVEPAEIQRSFRFLLSIDQICAAVIGTNIELPVLLAMWLSLSASEIRGLTKSKSIHDGQLYIVETVVNVKGGAYRKAGAKEEERPRAFKIPPYIADLIDMVDGDIIETRSAHALNQRFQRVLRNNGLPVMRFHDLRHLNASLMADMRIPDPIMQQRGGWKTDDVMKKVYTHVFTESRVEADKKIDAVFEDVVSKNTTKNTTTTKKP